MLTPEMIPPIVVAVPLGYTAWIWHLCRLRGLAIPFAYYRIFALAFAVQFAMYAIFHFFEIEIAVRGFWVRVSFIDLALCFAIPLTILYQQSRRHTVEP